MIIYDLNIQILELTRRLDTLCRVERVAKKCSAVCVCRCVLYLCIYQRLPPLDHSSSILSSICLAVDIGPGRRSFCSPRASYSGLSSRTCLSHCQRQLTSRHRQDIVSLLTNTGPAQCTAIPKRLSSLRIGKAFHDLCGKCNFGPRFWPHNCLRPKVLCDPLRIFEKYHLPTKVVDDRCSGWITNDPTDRYPPPPTHTHTNKHTGYMRTLVLYIERFVIYPVNQFGRSHLLSQSIRVHTCLCTLGLPTNVELKC